MMETPKQQAIKAAYGEHWSIVKNDVDVNGWLHSKELFGDKGRNLNLTGLTLITKNQYDPYQCYYKRPISLTGIENNNGWTRIESEEDLPKEKGDYWVVWNGKIIVQYWLRDNPDNPYNDMVQNNQVFSWMQAVTHYQPIETPKPPIF
ncbi:hypothetical protein HZQ61_02915 [Elizabethkingia anophelis]|nr:hypothetical protein [Elizabethkingia anophelis]